MAKNFQVKRKNLVGVIIWLRDPEGKIRVFLRHNKPFLGYPDEWNFIYGHIKPNEQIVKAAIRETKEETGLYIDHGDIFDLDHHISRINNRVKTTIHFVSINLEKIERTITLNEESIGFDWVLLNEAKKIMKHKEQLKVLDFIPLNSV